MNGNTNGAERQEIEQLLPWHAAGTLNRRDTLRVEAAVARDPELARQLALVREELAETIHVNETLGAPSARAMERLMAGIEAESGPAREVKPRFSFVSWVNGLLSGVSPRTLAFSATAAALVLVLQFGILTGIAVNRAVGPGSFETASGPTAPAPAAPGSYALIGFAPEASAAAVTGLLERHGLAIVDGPTAGGIYRVRLAAKPLPKAELDQAVEKLRAETSVVRFIAPTE